MLRYQKIGVAAGVSFDIPLSSKRKAMLLMAVYQDMGASYLHYDTLLSFLNF